MVEKYVLADIIECYEIVDNKKLFVEHKYVILNVYNKDTRVVQEDTFIKLTNHGLTVTEGV